jgi:hypothetical protein
MFSASSECRGFTSTAGILRLEAEKRILKPLRYSFGFALISRAPPRRRNKAFAQLRPDWLGALEAVGTEVDPVDGVDLVAARIEPTRAPGPKDRQVVATAVRPWIRSARES